MAILLLFHAAGTPLAHADGLVDSAAVIAINRQFKQMTRRGKFNDENRQLTTRLVYEEIRHRAKEGKELSAGAQVADLRDHEFRWKSFDDWHGTSWQSRVACAFETKNENEDDAVSYGGGPRLNNIVGAILNLTTIAKDILPASWNLTVPPEPTSGPVPPGPPPASAVKPRESTSA